MNTLRAFITALLLTSSIGPSWAGTSTITTKDAAGATKTFDVITDGGGNFGAMGGVCDGTALAQCAAVKAASTAAGATDPALVVAISPNNSVAVTSATFATSALQTTGNTALTTINTTLGTPLQQTGGTIATVTNLAQMNGAALLMGNGVTGTGSQRVTIASDNTAFSVNLGTIGGTATAANQATEISSLATIATNTGAAIPAGTQTIGNVGVIIPAGATAITASATGTTAATTATLAGTAGKTTYMCWSSVRANATAAATVTDTITGVITGTLSRSLWVAPNASGLGVDEMIYNPCVPASAQNTGIAIVSGAPGTGGVVTVNGGGYQL